MSNEKLLSLVEKLRDNMLRIKKADNLDKTKFNAKVMSAYLQLLQQTQKQLFDVRQQLLSVIITDCEKSDIQKAFDEFCVTPNFRFISDNTHDAMMHGNIEELIEQFLLYLNEVFERAEVSGAVFDYQLWHKVKAILLQKRKEAT